MLSRRWLLFGIAVAVLAVGAALLGEWQFSRLEDREQRNEWTRTNLAAEPAPVDDVLSTTRPVEPDQEWLRVRAVGRYDDSATVVLRYQTRDGASGVDVVTPLVTADGTGVLVDRGWVETDNTGDVPSDLPAPPAGEVEVVGWVRADSDGRGTDITDGSTRAISSARFAETVDYPLYVGFVDAEAETPEPATVPVRTELPDLGEGPHLFYGIQWWFFAALALFGFGYLAWDERRGRRRVTEPGSDPRPQESSPR